MNVLILDEPSRSEIQRVCAWAARHPLRQREVIRRLGDPDRLPVGADPRFACVVPVGHRCVFTIEEQPTGWCRHLSVCVLGAAEAPSVPAVEALLPEFGFQCQVNWLAPRRPLHVDQEEIGPHKIAVSIWDLLEPDERP